MKEFVEKTIDQLIELIVLLPAGGILLASMVWLWLDAAIVPSSVHSLLGDSSTAIVVMVIAASSLGLLMFGWASEGADAYLASTVSNRPISPRHALRRLAVRVLHWMPVPLMLRSPRVQATLHSMAIDYTDVEGLGYVERDEYNPSGDIRSWRAASSPGPWRSIARFTVLVGYLRPRRNAFHPKERGAPPWPERSYSSESSVDGLSQAWSPADDLPTYVSRITSELRDLHLQVVITLSVALALAVTAMEVVLRVGTGMLGVVGLPPASPDSLIAIGVASILSSIGLRCLAGRLWREELELAVLLVERITHDAQFQRIVRESGRR